MTCNLIKSVNGIESRVGGLPVIPRVGEFVEYDGVMYEVESVTYSVIDRDWQAVVLVRRLSRT